MFGEEDKWGCGNGLRDAGGAEVSKQRQPNSRNERAMGICL